MVKRNECYLPGNSLLTGQLHWDLRISLEEGNQVGGGTPCCSQFVKAKSGGEKEDLDELQKIFREGKSFDLSRLVKEYEIDVDNPISVELPGK